MSNKTKLTGDNYPHTKMMSLEEWKNFASNFRSKKTLKDFLLRRQFNSFNYFVQAGFIWKHTPQGHKYWSEIFSRTKPVS